MQTSESEIEQPKLNRAQRRAKKFKHNKVRGSRFNVAAQTANYVDVMDTKQRSLTQLYRTIQAK